MPASKGAKNPRSRLETLLQWTCAVAVVYAASAIVFGWRWWREQQGIDNQWRQAYEAATFEKDGLVQSIMADVDARAGSLEDHRNALSTRHVAALSRPAKSVSAVTEDANAAVTDEELAARYADADVTVLVAKAGPPRIVESVRSNDGHTEITRFYFNEQGGLMLVTRKGPGRTDLNDRWYFLDGEYVHFADRGFNTAQPPAGGRTTTYRYLPTDEGHIRSLYEELRAALVRAGLDPKAARIYIPGSPANDWKGVAFPPYVPPALPAQEPRTDATPAISEDAAKEIFNYTQDIDAKPLVQVEKPIAQPRPGDTPTITGYFDGQVLVKVAHHRVGDNFKRALVLFYRDGAMVAVENTEWSGSPSSGVFMSTTETFPVVDGRIVTYWLEDDGVRSMSEDSQRIKDIEAEMRADDAAARAVFATATT